MEKVVLYDCRTLLSCGTNEVLGNIRCNDPKSMQQNLEKHSKSLYVQKPGSSPYPFYKFWNY